MAAARRHASGGAAGWATRASGWELHLALTRGMCAGYLSAILRRQRRGPSTVRHGVEARRLQEFHRVDALARTARPHRRRSRGLAGEGPPKTNHAPRWAGQKG